MVEKNPSFGDNKRGEVVLLELDRELNKTLIKITETTDSSSVKKLLLSYRERVAKLLDDTFIDSFNKTEAEPKEEINLIDKWFQSLPPKTRELLTLLKNNEGVIGGEGFQEEVSQALETENPSLFVSDLEKKAAKLIDAYNEGKK